MSSLYKYAQHLQNNIQSLSVNVIHRYQWSPCIARDTTGAKLINHGKSDCPVVMGQCRNQSSYVVHLA